MICGPLFVSPCAPSMLRVALHFCASSHVRRKANQWQALTHRPGTMRSAYMRYLSQQIPQQRIL